MPRFHFNVFDGKPMPDPVGTDLPDTLSDRIDALRRAGDLIKDAAARADLGEEWRIEVTDDKGLTLFIMDFVVSESPAAQRNAARIDGISRNGHQNDG